jgi:hypothetical protein
MSDIKTSDIRPKRAAREPAHSQVHNHAVIGETVSGEAAVAEAVAAATAAVIERNVVQAPELVSTIALTQAVPVGPACPVPVPERSAAEKAPTSDEPAPDKLPAAAAETAWTAVAEAQSALARGFEKAAVEMTGIGRSGAAATADAAVALLGARTFAEALEINAALARRNFDTIFEASARLSEIGAKAVADASRPLLSRYGSGWNRLGTS